MHKLAVLGNPIAHSLSPLIFDLFAKQCGIELSYQRILAHDSCDFNQKIAQFFAEHGTALNITSPFKHDAYLAASGHTARSKFCRASNFLFSNDTITAKGDNLHQSGNHNNSLIIADTTDGIGLVNDILLNRNLSLAYKHILVIGSGFVVDSILLDLIAQNPYTIDILARNNSRVNYLNDKFGSGVFEHGKKYDLILNTTPNVVENTLFDQINLLTDMTFCYDLNYSAHKSLFLTKMSTLNANIHGCNGIGMLVEQAKVAFVKLFGKYPDTAKILEVLAASGI